LFIKSLESQGIPYYDDDMFSSGEHSHGCGHVIRTIHEGLRSTGADFITKGYHRDNITIRTGATVDKVIVEGEGDARRATGVKVIGKDGAAETFKAKKEIILSSGAYCSPAILLRSGIGPKEEVEKHGIKSVVELPGVGQNLQDHVVC
jgi:choline dehydrogenase-like flavoprotein